METKINDIKEFAIGTKIDYNGKLYKVIEQKFYLKIKDLVYLGNAQVLLEVMVNL